MLGNTLELSSLQHPICPHQTVQGKEAIQLTERSQATATQRLSPKKLISVARNKESNFVTRLQHPICRHSAQMSLKSSHSANLATPTLHPLDRILRVHMQTMTIPDSFTPVEPKWKRRSSTFGLWLSGSKRLALVPKATCGIIGQGDLRRSPGTKGLPAK